MQVEASQRAILQALDRLNLIGELKNDDYQFNSVKVRRFFQRASVQQIAQEAQALLQQGASVEQVAEQIASKWKPFLMDAVQVAAGDEVDAFEWFERSINRGRQLREKVRYWEPRPPNIFSIELSWLPEPQQREAERYLQYLQSKTRESVDAYLNALARAVGGERQDGIEFLLRFLRSGNCVEYYSGDFELVFAPDTESEVNSDQRIANLILWSVIEGRRESESLPCEGFYKGSATGLSIQGDIFLRSFEACGKCEHCFVMESLLRLLRYTLLALRYWSFGAVVEFVFQNTPLPPQIGYVEWYPPSNIYFPKDWIPLHLREGPKGVFQNLTSDLSFPISGRVMLHLIPCVSSEGVAAIHKRILQCAEARSWALRLHAAKTIHELATQAGEQSGSYYPDWQVHLTKPVIESLLADWNRHAPPEWRYTSQHAEKVFRKALRNARRAIDGVKE